MRLVLLFLPCLLASAQAPTEVPPRPATTPDELKSGEHLYQIHCAYCHGPEGEGGRGAKLAKTRLRHAPDAPALFRVISSGIPGTEMPRNNLSAHQTWQVVAYVQSLGRVVPQKVSGDAKRGQNLYQTKGNCASCHTISGNGGAVGPDLTEIGARKGVDYLRNALIDPSADVPDGFLEVRLLTKEGSRITGIRLNEDIFSIQLRDLSGNLHSFWKEELRELNKDPGKSPMPSYRRIFTPSELNDILAYLESLQGDQ